MAACPIWAAWAGWTCNRSFLAVRKGALRRPFFWVGFVGVIIRAFEKHGVLPCFPDGQVAQLVEQRTENPCVGGSIPPLATNHFKQTCCTTIAPFMVI